MELRYDELLGDFSSPLDFVSVYSANYDRQAQVPYKVFRDMIPYFSSFDITFLDHLFQHILANTESPGSLEEYLLHVENVILECRTRRFYDKEFYDLCCLIYIKALAFLVDQCEFKVLSYSLSQKKKDFVPYVKLLYRFSSERLDLRRLFTKMVRTNLENAVDVVNDLESVGNLIKETNSMLREIPELTKFNADKRYLDRLNISEKIVGSSRIEEYSFESTLNAVLDSIEAESKKMPKEQGYIRIMDFISEIELKNLGCKSINERAREIAQSIFK